MRSQYPVGDPAEEFTCTELYAGDYIIGVKSKGELLVIADLDHTRFSVLRVRGAGSL